MPTRTLDNNANIVDLRGETSAPPAGWPDHQAWWSVYTLGGDDTVYGSTYNDWVEGGDGNDTLYGFNGNDMLDGGNGTDTLIAGNGDDSLYGGAGNDQLYGEAGNDWLTGDAGNDTMAGGTGDDTFVGGDGADTMFGEAGNDVFFGDAGADIMDGGAGDDRLWGGAGNDQYQFNGVGYDVINDGVTDTGSPRTDTVFDTQDRLIVTYAAAEVQFFVSDGDDLLITSLNDTADGIIDNAVIIEDYFQGGHYVVDILQTSDGAFNLPALIPPMVA